MAAGRSGGAGPGRRISPGIVGLGKAIELATADIEGHNRKIRALRDRLMNGILAKIPHARLNGHPEKRLPGNINISFEFIEGESMLLWLDDEGICASTGSACTSGSLEPSHVLLATGLPVEISHGSLRLTLGNVNTDEDVDFVLEVLPKVVIPPAGDVPALYRRAGRKEAAMYSDKVMDHFKNPRNVGEIENADGIGEVGNPVCGDIMKIFLKIENNIITDAKFKTFGCGAAIASSSMATELVKGKTLEEAWEVSNKAVAEALEGLPPIKMHCSVLAEEGIHKAINDYRKKQGLEPWVEKNPHSHEHDEGTCQQ